MEPAHYTLGPPCGGNTTSVTHTRQTQIRSSIFSPCKHSKSLKRMWSFNIRTELFWMPMQNFKKLWRTGGGITCFWSQKTPNIQHNCDPRFPFLGSGWRCSKIAYVHRNLDPPFAGLSNFLLGWALLFIVYLKISRFRVQQLGYCFPAASTLALTGCLVLPWFLPGFVLILLFNGIKTNKGKKEWKTF